MSSNHLKEFRERAGVTQVELARMARMASTNLNAIEHGRLAPWPKVKRRLARALKTTLEELFPDEQTVGSLLLQNSECPTMTIPEFAEATGCSRNLAFRLARQNKLPVPVIFIGPKRMCVSRKAVLALLSCDTQKKGGR